MNTIVAFGVSGSDWFIEDDIERKRIMDFEEKIYEKHKALFDVICIFLDADSHNFESIQGIPIQEYKARLESMISAYEQEFEL